MRDISTSQLVDILNNGIPQGEFITFDGEIFLFNQAFESSKEARATVTYGGCKNIVLKEMSGEAKFRKYRIGHGPSPHFTLYFPVSRDEELKARLEHPNTKEDAIIIPLDSEGRLLRIDNPDNIAY